MTASEELTVPEPYSFPSWSGPKTSLELGGWSSQAKGRPGTDPAMVLQVLLWLPMVLTVNSSFVAALNRSGCKLLEELLLAPSSPDKRARELGTAPVPSPITIPPWDQSQWAGAGQCLREPSKNLAPGYCQDPFASTTPHLHARRLGADPTGMPTAQPFHLPARGTAALPSESGAGSRQLRSHLGSVAPDPQLPGRRRGDTSQK